MVGGYKVVAAIGVGAARLGGVRLVSELIFFMALCGDSLKAICRIVVTKAWDLLTHSFWHALQLVYCLVNFIGFLTL
jgi:hypothetical protein